jgi:hypothetical protein
MQTAASRRRRPFLRRRLLALHGYPVGRPVDDLADDPHQRENGEKPRPFVERAGERDDHTGHKREQSEDGQYHFRGQRRQADERACGAGHRGEERDERERSKPSPARRIPGINEFVQGFLPPM